MFEAKVSEGAWPTHCLKYRAIWISDVHLGTRGCQAYALVDFLHYTESEYLYLVGDVIDGWQLKKRWYWPQAHNDVIQKILRRARRGTKVFYIPGNHDEVARDFCGLQFGGALVVDQVVHETARGKRFLVLHGDQYDTVIAFAKWMAKLGDAAYTMLLVVNTYLNKLRRKLGFSYWSLSSFLKYKIKNAVAYIGAYEEILSDAARRASVDGIVCGHIHHPEIRKIGDVLYCNDGDWVESCTALVEDFEGNLFIVDWIKQREELLNKACEASCES